MDWEERFFDRHDRRLETEIRRGVDPRRLDEFQQAIIDLLELTNPRADEEATELDPVAVELWRAQEQSAKGERSMQGLERQEAPSPMVYRDSAAASNGHSAMYYADLQRLGARLVAQLQLHERGRAARKRAHVTKRRPRDPRRKRR